MKRGKGKRERQVAIYLAKVLSGEKGKEKWRYFGIKGPAVSEVIKGIEEKLDQESRLRKEIESLRGRMLPEF